ncbi:hypothetical protein BAE44_0019847 [Dichanthelium oligosanthes]|uniref:NB-ARC domain-containing protein n=1 Tax=Dichanthelium oligosanthes TaxID=888268 RepID=A0A1E5V297_9POAL|nr:hypothetical protein BAE44_0019847 [Dichanthelium oligosanthes]
MMTDIENLEKWVDKLDNKERAVLSIVGFRGVGKTTIARALYRKVSNKFDCGHLSLCLRIMTKTRSSGVY